MDGQKRDVYDFDAPCLAVDLAELHNAPSDDTWFERTSGHLTTPMREEYLALPQRVPHPAPKTEERPAPKIEEHLAPPSEEHLAPPSEERPAPPSEEHPAPPSEEHPAPPSEEHPPSEEQKEKRDKEPAASNIVTSWSDAKPSTSSTQPRRVSKRKQVSLDNSQNKRTKLGTEELELQRMRKLQQEVAEQRRKNEASYKAALAGNVPQKRTVLSSTVPREFNFRTSSRMKSSAVNNTKETKAAAAAVKTSGATVPKPFNLSTSRRRREDEPVSEPYVPMAQQVQRFHRRTPPRFHQPSRRVQEKGPSPARPQRARGPTVPHSFSLQVERRLQERRRPPADDEAQEEEAPQPFRSQPVPKRLLEGVTGVPEKKVVSVTVPESPAFVLKKRIRVEPPVEVKPPSPFRAPPVPHSGVPFQPVLPEQHQVEMCPFSFDKRETERRVLREKRLEQLRHEEVPRFKAQPLPDFSSVSLPEKKKLEPTKPEPFNLLMDLRGQQKTSHWEHMLKEERKAQEEAAQFKAGPNLVIHKEPFKPKKEERLETPEGPGFELQTERRAREREEFERHVSEKEALRALQEETRRQEEDEREKEETRRLRLEQVHKAQPVKLFKGVKVKKSELPLTVPQSPNFSDRFRM